MDVDTFQSGWGGVESSVIEEEAASGCGEDAGLSDVFMYI